LASSVVNLHNLSQAANLAAEAVRWKSKMPKGTEDAGAVTPMSRPHGQSKHGAVACLT